MKPMASLKRCRFCPPTRKKNTWNILNLIRYPMKVPILYTTVSRLTPKHFLSMQTDETQIDCQEYVHKLDKWKDLHLDMVQEVIGRESQRRSRCGLLRYRACHAGSALSCSNPFIMYSLFAASLSTVTCTYMSFIPEPYHNSLFFISPISKVWWVWWKHFLPHSLATTLDLSLSL